MDDLGLALLRRDKEKERETLNGNQLGSHTPNLVHLSTSSQPQSFTLLCYGYCFVDQHLALVLKKRYSFKASCYEGFGYTTLSRGHLEPWGSQFAFSSGNFAVDYKKKETCPCEDRFITVLRESLIGLAGFVRQWCPMLY